MVHQGAQSVKNAEKVGFGSLLANNQRVNGQKDQQSSTLN